MKKLMIAAACAAMIGGVYASDCGEDPEPDPDCVTVFTVKMTGKTAVENAAATYKTVQKFAATGKLTLDADYVTEALSVTIGKDKGNVVLDGDVTKCTYFGKNLETVLDEELRKQGKRYSLESDLGLTAENDYFSLTQVAFGKVNVYITKDKTIKGKKSDCGDGTADEDILGCVPELTPVSYSGWFTGTIVQDCMDEEAYNDDCVELDDDADVALVGGTWTAKYDKKNSVLGR